MLYLWQKWYQFMNTLDNIIVRLFRNLPIRSHGLYLQIFQHKTLFSWFSITRSRAKKNLVMHCIIYYTNTSIYTKVFHGLFYYQPMSARSEGRIEPEKDEKRENREIWEGEEAGGKAEAEQRRVRRGRKTGAARGGNPRRLGLLRRRTHTTK